MNIDYPFDGVNQCMLIAGILLLVIQFFQVDVRWGISACELFYCYFFFCPCKEYQLNSQIYGAIFQINKEVMKILRLQHAKDKLSPGYDKQTIEKGVEGVASLP